jgi:hypothetical protein
MFNLNRAKWIIGKFTLHFHEIILVIFKGTFS